MTDQTDYPDTAGPTEWRAPIDGMSLREHFAGLAMQGSLAGEISHYGLTFDENLDNIAQRSYKMADAMLRARDAK